MPPPALGRYSADTWVFTCLRPWLLLLPDFTLVYHPCCQLSFRPKHVITPGLFSCNSISFRILLNSVQRTRRCKPYPPLTGHLPSLKSLPIQPTGMTHLFVGWTAVGFRSVTCSGQRLGGLRDSQPGMILLGFPTKS